MNFLNFSDSESRPALKLISLAFVVFNAVILALLIFGPGRLTSGSTQNGTDPGTGPVQSASAGYTSGQESQGSYNDEDIDEETREEDDDRYRGRDSEDDDFRDKDNDRSSRDYSENTSDRDEDDDRNDMENTENASTSDSEDEDDDDQNSSNGPVLELTDDHVTLHVGDEFNFYSYIKTMRDRDGSELSRYIHLSGNVDTYTPGDYRITYRITSPIDGESTSKDLLVTVRP